MRGLRVCIPCGLIQTDTQIDLGLWEEKGQNLKAATYFEKAGLYKDASRSYTLDGKYEQAVEVLRRGNMFDHLIDYIYRYLFDISMLFLKLLILEIGTAKISSRAPYTDIQGSAISC